MKFVRGAFAAILLALLPAALIAQNGPLKITITDGVIEPLPIAVPDFVPEGGGDSAQYASQIARVVAADLAGSGLFREIPREAFISGLTSFDAPIAYPDWKAINAQALVTGAVSVGGDGILVVKFRLYDIFADSQLGDGQQFIGNANSWRRIGHKIADQIYSRITGEGGYFDSRIVFVSETGSKEAARNGWQSWIPTGRMCSI